MTRYLLSWIILLQYGLASPLIPSPHSKRGGQSTNPTCWYDEGGGVQCNGAPHIPFCDEARDQACRIFSAMEPSNTTNVVIIIGDENSKDSGLEAQCLVSVYHNSHDTEKVSMEVCQNKFMSLEGCQNPSNHNYSPQCVGGNINVHFNDNKIGTAVDESQPSYALGIPQGMAGAGAAVYKPGELTQETTTSGSAGSTSSNVGGRTSAGGARSGGGGVSAGVGYAGEMGE